MTLHVLLTHAEQPVNGVQLCCLTQEPHSGNDV